jgi:hypothetical protein
MSFSEEKDQTILREEGLLLGWLPTITITLEVDLAPLRMEPLSPFFLHL